MPRKTSPMTWVEHLEELRKRLLVCLVALGVGTLAGFFYSEKVLHWMVLPIQPSVHPLYFFSPAEAFMIRLKISLLTGLFLALPFLMSQIWLFISPALHAKEKKILLPVMAAIFLLFLTGAFFCFKVVIPTALHFFMGMQSEFLKPMISIDHYLSFVSAMVLAFGVAFNLPVFILALVWLGWLDSRRLNRFQKPAIILIFIAAAVLTPGPDVASQFFLAIPLLVLFEISVLGATAIEFFRNKTLAGDRSLTGRV